MRVDLYHPRFGDLAFLLSVMLLAAPILAAQQMSGPSPVDTAIPARPVLIVYAQHRMPEESWTALFAALKKELPELSSIVPAADANPELVRGGHLADASMVRKPITVYLLGDCMAPLAEEPFPGVQRLGWVSKVDGQIVPIIHVECTEIGAEISGQTERMDHDRRTAAMSEAVARVILHEWVHVATQSAAHGAEGVTKPIFKADDLLCGDQARNCARQQSLNGSAQK
jgi:hypothetical protein